MSNTSDTYKGNVASAGYNGEATLIIDDKGLTVSSLFSDFAAGFEDFLAIKAGDYTVDVVVEGGTICCSRMGQSGDWFATNLTKAYNRAVTRALKTKGECLFETRGSMAYEGIHIKGTVQVFEDAICLLPPKLEGRRLPFAFINGLKKENYALTIHLTTGESAVISMVGRDLDPLEKCIVERVKAIRAKSGELAASLCGELGEAEKAKAANLFAEKIAVPLERLAALPKLREAVLKKIEGSDMGNTWRLLCELCDGQKAAVGIWELPEEEVEKLKEKLLEKMQAEAEAAGSDGQGEGGGTELSIELMPEQEEALRWMIWTAVPSKDGKVAVVEAAFPNEEVATYVYRIPDSWETFLPVLNRAMEAIDFDRELILLPEEKFDGSVGFGAELTEGFADKKMLIKRTPSLGVLRRCFDGRIVHRSLASWEKGLRGYLGG